MTKTCTGCSGTYPVTDEFFYRDSSKLTGFATRCKVCVNKRNAAWNLAHLAEMKRYHAEYERLRATERKLYLKQYRAENREKAIQYLRDWRKANPGQTRTQKQYKKNNPERVRAWMRRSKQKRRVTDVCILSSLVDLKLIYQSYSGLCGICDDQVTFDSCHWDHIIPVSKGGTDAPTNLEPSHQFCNSMKGNRTLEWARNRIRERRAANALRQR